jgi:hypothetical protein
VNDTVEAWSRVVTDRVGLPIDVWAVAAVLESEGLRDHDARARFGEAHLFALAQAVYRHAVTHAPATPPATLPAETEIPRVRRLARDLGESALLTLPLVTQLACGALFDHSLVAARGLSPRDGAILSAAAATSGITAGAVAATVHHEGAEARATRDAVRAARAVTAAFTSGAALALATSGCVALGWVLSPIGRARDLAWLVAHHLALCAVWVALAALVALGERLAVAALLALGALGVAALAALGMDAHGAVLTGGALVTLVALGDLARTTRRFAHTHRREPAAPLKSLDLRVGGALPRAAYGAGYFALLMVDRLTAWTLDVGGAGARDTGAGVALLTFLLPAALAEHLAAEFDRTLAAAERRLPAHAVTSLRALARRALGSSVALLVGAGALNVTLVGGAWRASHRGALDAISLRVFVCGALGCQLLALGAFAALVHLGSARLTSPARALWLAVIVDALVAGALGRTLDASWAPVGLIAGAATFAFVTLRGADRIAGSIDHARYAAY